MTRWAVVTGEFPPQPGGVSDYTGLVAGGLTAAGDRVAVYAPPAPAAGTAVRLPDHFGPRALLALDRHLARSRPDRILIQYTPQAFGYKGLNLPFAAWVSARAARLAPVWVMFHEVMTTGDPRRPVRAAALTAVTRQMARRVARAATRVFVSIPAWAAMLRRICHAAPPAEWLPVPSTVPAAADPVERDRVRAAVAPCGQAVVGHFGTFGGMNAGLVGPAVGGLLRADPGRVALFVGRGSDTFRERFAAAHPDLVARVTATGELDPPAAAARLAACDLLVQPYPDGVTSRRTSAMAGLALGVPTATNLGFLSEPVWAAEAPGVAVAKSADAADLVPAAEAVLALSPNERAARGRAAAAWYRSRFALEHTIAALRTPPRG